MCFTSFSSVQLLTAVSRLEFSIADTHDAMPAAMLEAQVCTLVGAHRPPWQFAGTANPQHQLPDPHGRAVPDWWHRCVSLGPGGPCASSQKGLMACLSRFGVDLQQ